MRFRKNCTFQSRQATNNARHLSVHLNRSKGEAALRTTCTFWCLLIITLGTLRTLSCFHPSHLSDISPVLTVSFQQEKDYFDPELRQSGLDTTPTMDSIPPIQPPVVFTCSTDARKKGSENSSATDLPEIQGYNRLTTKKLLRKLDGRLLPWLAFIYL